MKKNTFLKIIGFFLLALMTVSAGFVFWALCASQPLPQALAAMHSDDLVRVEQGEWITYEPVDRTHAVGVIFYPGGRVDARVYAPLLKRIAAEGYLVVEPSMPLNLALFGVNRADQVMLAHPEVDTWVLGGHSLGGAMAAQYTHQHPAIISGSFFWASFPAEQSSLADQSLPVLSISAELDGLSTPEKIDASRAYLPASAEFFQIKGGNHTQFGWYNLQNGDLAAQISVEDQQEQIYQKMSQFLAAIENQ